MFPDVRTVSAKWQTPIEKGQSLVAPYRFQFLNEEREITVRSDWNRSEWPKLWLYNLHYFDDLNAMDASERSEWHHALIARWISENPPGIGVGWEPYPLSIRIINWIKWALAGNILPHKALENLVIQVRFLYKRLEYDLLGNHLLSNAKALIFSGCFFQGEEADRWFGKGIKILKRQIPEQVLSDGGQFERSPMYHALALEDILDLFNIVNAYRMRCSDGQRSLIDWYDVVTRMLYWLRTMCHPDGNIGFFNDAVIGVAPALDELDRYASRLGFANFPSHGEGITQLKDSGYIRIQKNSLVTILDVAPLGPDYLPAHGHADTLSFETSLYGQRVMVNSGISCYGESPDRLWQRSTAAHNTVVVNRENSSEVWSGFRVARRAKAEILAIEERNDIIKISALHDGYKRLSGKNIHKRNWIFNGNSMEIRDEISGPFSIAEIYFYFHPDVTFQIIDDNRLLLSLIDGRKIAFRTDNGRIKCTASTWYPAFGCSKPNNCAVVRMEKPTVRTLITWDSDN